MGMKLLCLFVTVFTAAHAGYTEEAKSIEGYWEKVYSNESNWETPPSGPTPNPAYTARIRSSTLETRYFIICVTVDLIRRHLRTPEGKSLLPETEPKRRLAWQRWLPRISAHVYKESDRRLRELFESDIAALRRYRDEVLQKVPPIP